MKSCRAVGSGGDAGECTALNTIAVGPDALWFTEELGNKIGRITVAGAFTEYIVPTAGSLPGGSPRVRYCETAVASRGCSA